MVLGEDVNGERVFKELARLNENKRVLEGRENTLGVMCSLIKLERFNGLIVAEGQRTISQDLVEKIKGKSANNTNRKESPEINSKSSIHSHSAMSSQADKHL